MTDDRTKHRISLAATALLAFWFGILCGAAWNAWVMSKCPN